MEKIIISRHQGMVQWLKNNGVTGNVITHVIDDETVKGKDVYGVLPLGLAYLANSITTIDMPLLPADKRGQDLSPEDMDLAGATMSTYKVTKTKL